MEKKEILETLNERVYRGTKISNIEKEVGLPKNSLASVLTGKKIMPNKWVPKLVDYIRKQIGTELQKQNEIETKENAVSRSHGFHDITCSANPAEPMGSYGCSCGMFKRAKRAEKLVEELRNTVSELQGAIKEYENVVHGQNKPIPALKTEKLPKSTQKEEKGKEGAENSPIQYVKEHKEYYDAPPIDPGKIKDEHPQYPEQMPEGLSEIQQAVWRNNQKMKTKTPPITQFGVTKKEKS